MSETLIPVGEEEKRRRNGCNISIHPDYISIHWDEPLPDGPHKVSRVEAIAAGALLGIARVLTGKGEEDLLRAISSAERRKARR